MGNQVNVATRQVDISDISGGGGVWGGDMGNKNRPNECSCIIDTGFNVGGLRSFAWLGKYLEYLKSFYHKANIVKTKEKSFGFALSGIRKGVIQKWVP